MTAQHRTLEDSRVEAALEELKGLVLQRFPDASFSVCRGPDEPESIELLAYVDIEDIEEVLDVVIDRLLDMQNEEGLPLHVIPVRPAR